MTEIVSWNVNGIRSVATKCFFEWMSATSPDIVCIQETKADPSQLTKEFFEHRHGEGSTMSVHWASAKRRGYSGVAIYSKKEPQAVRMLGLEEFDDEGRYLEADFGDVVVVSAYFPNSQEAGARIDYKLRFCDAVLARCDAVVAEGRHIVVSGDYNIAHTPIDLTYPKANEANPGYLPQERDWMTKFLSRGYIDTFRHQHPGEAGQYSWWSYRMKAREKDIGWRLDYHCVNAALLPLVRATGISKSVMGSDHCPVTLRLDI